MIHIDNATDIRGKTVSISIASYQEKRVDATGLLLLPALTDPHVHFRTPGLEHKENWMTAAASAIAGGVTMVYDMPNTIPPCFTYEKLIEKQEIIDAQLKNCGIPLSYRLYLGADKKHFSEIGRCKGVAAGVKIYMGSSTGDLVMDDLESLEKVFKLAKEHEMVVAIHAEDEKMIEERTSLFAKEYESHSKIRSPEVAVKATTMAIELCAKYGTSLYIAHVSTKDELPLIAAAKKRGLPVYAETTPHHLFLDTSAYATFGAIAQVNPPIRPPEHGKALLEALESGLIDTVGSDHAPHTREEKALPYGKSPSGIAGIQFTLPLLLDAYNKGHLSLETIVRTCCVNPRKIFDLPPTSDWVLVDLSCEKSVSDGMMRSKSPFSPYAGRTLKGWPRYTICEGILYEL